MSTEAPGSSAATPHLQSVIDRARAATQARKAGEEVYTGPKVSERLRRKFGVGQAPAKRLAFYAQLDRLHERFGLVLEEIISEAVAESVGADAPDRYFCRAMKCKLRDRGLTLTRPGEADW